MKAEYFESAEVSDLGRKRKNNEDACLRIPEHGVYCVADGMGGEAGGDLASEAITTALQEVFSKAGPGEDGTLAQRIALFRRGINQASKWIKNFADEKVIGQMGSTVIALVVDPRNPARAVGLHAGDSRLYRFRQGGLKLLTADHSAVAALAAKLGRDPASIPAKYQNELTRCVGLTETVELEKTPVDVLSGDLFLICSDGLTKMLPDEGIAGILANGAKGPIGALAQTLIDKANEAGGKDNVSVVLARAGDISGVPGVAGAEEDDEAMTLEATVVAPADESANPLNRPGDSSGTSDTGGVIHGDTPRTEDVTADRTPNTIQPHEAPRDAAGKKKTAGEGAAAGAGKRLPIGWAIVVVCVLAGGIAGWRIGASRPKSAADASLSPAVNKATVVETPVVPSPQAAVAEKPAPSAPATTPPAQRIVESKPTLTASPVIPPPPAVEGKGVAIAPAIVPPVQPAVIAPPMIPPAQSAVPKEAVVQAQPDLAAAGEGRPKEPAPSTLKDVVSEAEKTAQAGLGTQGSAGAAAEAPRETPEETAAAKLREETEQLAVVAAADRKFQAVLQEGQDAMKNNDFALAALKAKEALALRPDDPAALKLANGIQEPMDLQNAKKAFEQGDYGAVADLCKGHPGVEDFTHLAKISHDEQSALADAWSAFQNSDYKFADALRRQTYGTKIPFAALIKKSDSEWKTLQEFRALEQSNDWQIMLNRLADPASAGLVNKSQFHAMAVWAANQKELSRLNIAFETMQVKFNVRGPTDPNIQTPEARKEQRIEGALDEAQRQKYLKDLDQLEGGYKKGGWLDQNRVKFIKKLRDAISHYT